VGGTTQVFDCTEGDPVKIQHKSSERPSYLDVDNKYGRENVEYMLLLKAGRLEYLGENASKAPSRRVSCVTFSTRLLWQSYELFSVRTCK
jgi:hypothetical protein